VVAFHAPVGVLVLVEERTAEEPSENVTRAEYSRPAACAHVEAVRGAHGEHKRRGAGVGTVRGLPQVRSVPRAAHECAVRIEEVVRVGQATAPKIRTMRS
jgi:hypothetical protein